MDFSRVFGVLFISFALAGCGQSAGVSIGSEAFYTAQAQSSAQMVDAPVTEFKFCISRVRLIGADGESEEIRFAPGLIDVSDGEAEDWGKIEVPEGFKLTGIRVKVHKDKELCGVDYSIAFNGATTSQDIELKWRFDPAIELDPLVTKVRVSLDEVVADLRASVSGPGELPSLKDRIEGVVGSAKAE